MTKTVEETRLTDEGFWDHFWASLKVPARVNPVSSFDRGLGRAFLRLVPDGRGKSLVEIGAAPGRWLVFFHEKLGYAVDGIEYIRSACRKTEENLAECGVAGRVFQQDFFQNDLPRHSYDVVLSLGFIEHFSELDPVIRGHTDLLKPDGLLVLGVPNLRGLHGAVVRRTDPDTLAAHNLEVMSVPFMQELAPKHDLEPLWIGYLGGINPGLITVADGGVENEPGIAALLRRQGPARLRFLFRALSFVRNRIAPLDHMNGPGISNYLLAVYRYVPHKHAEAAAGAA